MHILPPLETVKDIAATQQYDVLPLSCEILSDFITPHRSDVTAGAATRFWASTQSSRSRALTAK